MGRKNGELGKRSGKWKKKMEMRMEKKKKKNNNNNSNKKKKKTWKESIVNVPCTHNRVLIKENQLIKWALRRFKIQVLYPAF